MKTCLTALAIVVLILGLAACSGGSRSTKTASPVSTPDCLTASGTPVVDEPVVAVLPGITNADTNATIESDRLATFATVMNGGFNMKALLLGDVIGAGVADADLGINARLEGEGPNDLMRKQNATCKRAKLTTAFRHLSARRTDGPTDVVTSLRTLEAHLVGLPKKNVSVVLMTSMLNGSSALNLQDPATLAPGVDKAIDALQAKGLLPDCRSWHVYAIGAGRLPTGGLDGERDEQLHQFWSAFFHRCGGTLVVYDQALAEFPVKPVSGTALSPTTTRPVTVRTAGLALIASVPADVLFDVGVATLRPEAEPVLRKLLDETLSTYPNGRITVTGYTDSTGTVDGNLDLSQRRAGAVTDWLIREGIAPDRVTAAGRGAVDPVGDNHSPEGRQANRRVDISVTP